MIWSCSMNMKQHTCVRTLSIHCAKTPCLGLKLQNHRLNFRIGCVSWADQAYFCFLHAQVCRRACWILACTGSMDDTPGEWETVCVCGACDTAETARGLECPKKCTFKHIACLTRGIPRRAEQEFDNDLLSLAFVNALTGIEIYRRDIRSPLLCYTLLCWFLENKTNYEPHRDGGHWKYWSYFLPNGRGGRLQLLSMVLDLLGDIHPRDKLTIQLLRTSCEVCEICRNTEEDEIIDFINCGFCGARPCRHHGRCCPALIRGQRYQDLCEPRTVVALLSFVLDEVRLNEIFQAYGEHKILTVGLPAPLDVVDTNRHI